MDESDELATAAYVRWWAMNVSPPIGPGLWFLGALIVGLTLSACYGDPHFDVFVRNDSSETRVVVVEFAERGLTGRYLASADTQGGTLSGVGHFSGVIRLFDAATCTLAAELPANGELPAVVISDAGDVRLTNYDDAFPDRSHTQLPITDLCASNSG